MILFSRLSWKSDIHSVFICKASVGLPWCHNQTDKSFALFTLFIKTKYCITRPLY